MNIYICIAIIKLYEAKSRVPTHHIAHWFIFTSTGNGVWPCLSPCEFGREGTQRSADGQTLLYIYGSYILNNDPYAYSSSMLQYEPLLPDVREERLAVVRVARHR